MRSVVLALLVSTCLCAMVSSPAWAEEKNPELAREKFEAGKRAYRLGKFAKAIEEWQAGYELKDDPIFLYNIAQAYREAKDFEKAIFFYDSYLKEAPRAENRAQVLERVAEMKKILAAQSSQSTAPPTGPSEPGKRPEAPPSPPPPVKLEPEPAASAAHPGRGLKIAGYVTASAGVALVVTGIVFWLQASAAQSDIEYATVNHLPWSADLQSKDESGARAATLSAVTLSVGIAAIAGGGVMVLLGARKDRVSLFPEVNGTQATLQLRWRY